MKEVIRQEVYCSLLLSELCRMSVCPNYVQVYEVRSLIFYVFYVDAVLFKC